MKFRAIVTAEETPACLSIDLIGHSERRQELCSQPSMVLTSLSILNLNQDLKEEFTIQAGKHQSIYINFMYFYMPCYDELFHSSFQSKFTIEDVVGKIEICSVREPPEIYKSKGSMIHIYSWVDPSENEIRGFRIQYKFSDHSLQRYTSEIKGVESSVCSRLFRKCYTVLSEEVSWNIANTTCRKRNEYLVTILSKKEMNYVQYLLRSALYQQMETSEDGADKRNVHTAHIGLKRLKDKQRRTEFIWMNSFNVTYSAW
ncbi:uncharacterized protein LOC132713751 [Ruditapes philippinarum]|uniref:uncharacterized protein LOC132713751 n=1 Tax=Ruditapes philippinarum TaxID=129788 RepID=UPI00295BAD3B|nr:uncharacterized protein LOC132713751 [Ruditapes philippinarum]